MLSRVIKRSTIDLCRGCKSGKAVPVRNFSAGHSDKPKNVVEKEADTMWSRVPEESTYKFGEHRSNAEQLIKKIPVIYVPAKVAVCDGGGGALGHPLQYIQVQGMKPGEFNSCKYCGLRYAMAEGHHGH